MYNYRLPFKKVADPFGSHSPQRKAMGLGPHRGVDYNGFKAGTPLPAVGDGVITLNKWTNVLGWVVELKVGKHYFLYCHMDKQSPLKVGTKVKSGDSVGGAGTTGSASSGVHLHFTLSLTSGGGITGKVYDAHTFLQKMIKSEAAAAKAAAKAAAPVEATVAPVTPTPKASKKETPLA
jgi:murein DD-endopeptidase MepM/ murein hydrolase activator NlpD